MSIHGPTARPEPQTATLAEEPQVVNATARAPKTFSSRNDERLRNLIDEFNAAFLDQRESAAE